MTTKQIYRLSTQKLKEAGIKSSEIDARLLICHALNISPEKFIIDSEKEISFVKIRKINNLIKKRALNIPVAYLTGEKEFFGLNFRVNKNVLIPRPETEWIVEKSIKSVKPKVDKIKVLDMGTGTGNIIISLAINSDADFFACDISADALAVAKQNAKRNNIEEKIKFYESDLFSNKKLKQKFNLIIANLPYVPKKDKDKSVKFEPVNAIFANDNGSEIIKRFLKQAPNYLQSNGTILIELDPRNANELKSFAKKYFPDQKIGLEEDLAGFLRYLVVEN
ncbi:TPA: peptide chain release factor N(5)-glutamine methyltransferase [Candidatus Berkelbacteria bacterium]|uniref:Protein-(Glutamine-N5) methyltransferase, release factor glutamine methyltransferase n=1 Tax=Berkelbacteria bacterium GW2011_GWE1_39_12 TaxID=1618337 RepID=A0A0G4B2C6_9BACT|nr:MAG: protein-(glutamine-N5) methyltransferase, release factor glutamine methyltransferase [Berkelbacteria bacterium GW2011_GWE1_39_12]HBO60598.1 peptide chain release factor N(5)-glutamine methyltransferase [Candidatus Berkelbacteria bacterium]